MKALPRLFAIALATIAVVAVVLAVAVYVINWSDEVLSASAAARLTPDPVNTDAAKNGAYAVVGLGADDPVAYGKRWFEAAAIRDPAALKERLGQLGEPKPALHPATQCPELDGHNCLGRHLADPAPAQAIADTGRPLAVQYRRLRDYAAFEEPQASIEVSLEVPAYGRVLRAQEVVFAEVALAATAGDLDRAIAELAAELALHRRLLAGSRNLVTKMIMRRAVQRDLQALADLGAFRPAALVRGARVLEPVLAPLSAAERTVEAAYWNEFRATARLYAGMGRRQLTRWEVADLPANEWWWNLRPIAYQTNATINRDYELREPMAAALRAPPAELAAGLEAAAKRSRERATALYRGLAPYNLAGNRLAAYLFLDSTEYAFAVQDVDGLLRLFNAALLLAREGRNPDDATAALAKGGARTADPYTGKPVAWDAASKTVWFEPRSGRSAREQVGPNPKRWSVTVPAAR